MKSLAVLSATVVVGLGCAAMSCSSNSSPGGNASGGATSALGGSTSSSGGSSSTHPSGGSTSASGGSTAGGGCTKSNTDKAPSGDLLGGLGDDAGTGDAGLAIQGGISTYGNARGVIVDGDTLQITENASATTATQYVGAVLYFNNCVDAVQFSGVEFAISGTLTGCTVQFSANFSATTAAATDKKGTCTAASCYAPQKSITVSSSPTQIRIQWEDLGTAGSPVGPVDESQLTGLQWQLTIPSGSTCSASIMVSNLKFF